jgi:thiamine transport system ATP-binding protein
MTEVPSAVGRGLTRASTYEGPDEPSERPSAPRRHADRADARRSRSTSPHDLWAGLRRLSPSASARTLVGGSAARFGDTSSGLRVENVTVRFDTTTALSDFSLDVPPGEVVALLGPSGCGKSTLLRAIAGLQRVHAGRITWGGQDLLPIPVHQRGFGLMFQDGQLFVHRDVAGNVAFGLEMARMSRARRRARVTELLELVGLAGYEKRSVTTLSGGEQQRVALARALAPDPRLLLLDEPLTSLDRLLRERLSGELATILRRTGTTALYVTHDHDEAFAVADRIAVMAEGRMLQVGTPTELWRHPASLQIAAFLGYETFLPGNADDGAPALVAVARAAARVVTNGYPPSERPRVGARILGGRPLEGSVVAARISRGGQVVDVELDVPAGCVLTARVDGVGRWLAGTRVVLELDPAGTVVLPAGANPSRAAAGGSRGYDRRP